MSTVSLTGNLTKDPELRFTPNGSATAELGIAENRRYFNRQSDEWAEEVSFFDVVAWGDLAENVAASFHQGDRVAVTGRLRQERWTDRSDQRQSRIRIVATDVAASTRFATVIITRTERRQRADAEADDAPGEEPLAAVTRPPFLGLGAFGRARTRGLGDASSHS